MKFNDFKRFSKRHAAQALLEIYIFFFDLVLFLILSNAAFQFSFLYVFLTVSSFI